jgi:hypothetical protein
MRPRRCAGAVESGLKDLQTGEHAADLEFAQSLVAILLGAERKRGPQLGNCRA